MCKIRTVVLNMGKQQKHPGVKKKKKDAMAFPPVNWVRMSEEDLNVGIA